MQALFLCDPYPNIWLGVSVEDQKTADERIPLLLQCPAAVRWLSCEPLLGRVDLCEHLGMWWNQTMGVFEGTSARINASHFMGQQRIGWVVAGGESGRGARPMHPDWARSLRDQCAAASVPFFFKQWGEFSLDYDRDRNDPDYRRCGDGPQGLDNDRPHLWTMDTFSRAGCRAEGRGPMGAVCQSSVA